MTTKINFCTQNVPDEHWNIGDIVWTLINRPHGQRSVACVAFDLSCPPAKIQTPQSSIQLCRVTRSGARWRQNDRVLADGQRHVSQHVGAAAAHRARAPRHRVAQGSIRRFIPPFYRQFDSLVSFLRSIVDSRLSRRSLFDL